MSEERPEATGKIDASQLSFEEAYARLETVVRRLETGEATLDEALQLFEEGVALTRACTHLLDKAEARINLLLAAEDGTPQTRPFQPENTGEAV